MAASLPTEIGGWTLLAPMGKGAMGQVWKVHRRTVTGASVLAVMKLPLAGGVADAEAGHRWLSEATLLMKAQTCGHVVRVFDLGVDRGIYYLVMDYVHGTDLGRLLRVIRHAHRAREPRAYLPLEIGVAVWIGAQLMLALSEIHGLTIAGLAQGIIHKDVAPKNILLSVDGEVKLSDFGIATARDVELTNAGTLRYMAPEHHAGFACQASDVYAGAVTLWEMIELVNYRSSDADACRREMFAPPRPLTRPGVPQPIAELLAAALAPRAEDRPTAVEFVDAIERSGSYVPGERAVGRLVKHYIVGAATSGQTQTFQAADAMQRTSSLDGLLLERERKAAHEPLDTARMIERARARGRRGADDDEPVAWPALEAAIARANAARAPAPAGADDLAAAPDAEARPTGAETDAPRPRRAGPDDTMLEPPPRPSTAVLPPELLGVPITSPAPPPALVVFDSPAPMQPPSPASPLPPASPRAIRPAAGPAQVPPMPGTATPSGAEVIERVAHERPITLADGWPATAQSSTLEDGPTLRAQREKRRFAIGVAVAAVTAIVLGTVGGLIAADWIAPPAVVDPAVSAPAGVRSSPAASAAAAPVSAETDDAPPSGPRLEPQPRPVAPASSAPSSTSSAASDAREPARSGAIVPASVPTSPIAAPAADAGTSNTAVATEPSPGPVAAPPTASTPRPTSGTASGPKSVTAPRATKVAVTIYLDFIAGTDVSFDRQRFTIVRDGDVQVSAGKHRVRWREHGDERWHDAGRIDFDAGHRHVLRFGATGTRGYSYSALPPAGAGVKP